MAKYDVYAKGLYLCTINQTLRVIAGAFDSEHYLNAMQVLIDQHPIGLLVMPDGKHKRSDLVDLHQVAPKLVRQKRPGNKIKRPTNSKGRGSHFCKKSPPVINGLQGDKSVFLANLKSTGVANKGIS